MQRQPKQINDVFGKDDLKRLVPVAGFRKKKKELSPEDYLALETAEDHKADYVYFRHNTDRPSSIRFAQAYVYDRTQGTLGPLFAGKDSGDGLKKIEVVVKLFKLQEVRARCFKILRGMPTNPYYHGIEQHVGHTPLIRLRRLSELTGCEILGKAEFMNPGGSVKDRAALSIIAAAETSGQLKPGGTIIEGSAGNTGIGLTLIGHSKGYRSVIVIPETQSQEKISLLRTLSDEVITVPEKPYNHSGNYNRVAQRLSEEKGWFWANQFDNQANRLAHYRTTGPEIWEQTRGEVSAFVSSVGSGGTLAGTTLFLKERSSKIAAVCADPYGAAMWSWFTNGNTETKGGDSFAEGIGQTRVTKNLEGISVDRAYRIPDQAALTVIYQLMREEGLFLGLSSGINLAGAVRFAKESGPGQTIVTVLCDSGIKYQSKLFNLSWLKEHNLDPHRPIESILD